MWIRRNTVKVVPTLRPLVGCSYQLHPHLEAKGNSAAQGSVLASAGQSLPSRGFTAARLPPGYFKDSHALEGTP